MSSTREVKNPNIFASSVAASIPHFQVLHRALVSKILQGKITRQLFSFRQLLQMMQLCPSTDQ